VDAGNYAEPQEIVGSSTESFADAAVRALKDNPGSGNHRLLKVTGMEIEEGGFVGRTIFRVTLNPQPLPPEPPESSARAPQPLPPKSSEESDLNPQPLPPVE
jgi:hypothetical protein